jgi:hypothetical protein
MSARPNTLTLPEVRSLADGPAAAYAPAILFIDQFVAARESARATTLLSLTSGETFEIDMTLERFQRRLTLDNAAS